MTRVAMRGPFLAKIVAVAIALTVAVRYQMLLEPGSRLAAIPLAVTATLVTSAAVVAVTTRPAIPSRTRRLALWAVAVLLGVVGIIGAWSIGLPVLVAAGLLGWAAHRS